MKAHATKVLNSVAEAANDIGVPCETVQLVKDHPYESIIATAKDKDCDLIVMASHGRSGDCGSRAWQCDRKSRHGAQ